MLIKNCIMTRIMLATLSLCFSLSAYSQTLSELQTFRGSDTPNGTGNTDNFGYDMAISGDFVAISAPRHNGVSGAVYVFELSGANQWVEVAKLTASDAATDKKFGTSVAFVGDVVVVGNGAVDFALQGAYIFEKPVAGWTNMTETIKLTSPAPVNSSNASAFGINVDFNGSEILVSAPYEDAGTVANGGKMYVYEKSGASWSSAFLRAELYSTNVGIADFLGFSAILGDDFIAASALTGSNAGTLHIYDRPVSGIWANSTAEDLILLGSDRAAGLSFGGGLVSDGDLVVTYSTANSMSAYVFERENQNWSTNINTNEVILRQFPSYYLNSGFSGHADFNGLQIQNRLMVHGSGSSVGPTSGNSLPVGVVQIINDATGESIEIDGFQYLPDGAFFGNNIALEGSKLLIASRAETRGGVVRYFDLSYTESSSMQLCPAGSISFGTQTITAPGTYVETFTASASGLDSTVTLTVTGSDLNLSMTRIDNQCFGESNGQIDLTGSGGVAPYEYSIDGSTYVSNSTFSGLSTGSYTGYIRDANGCVVSSTIDVEEPDQLTLDVGVVTDAICNGEASGSITISATGGIGIIGFSIDGSNFAPSPITGLLAGTYDITAQDENGCERIIWSNVVVSEPDETKTPIVSDFNTIYGSTATNIMISPDPTDMVANHFYFPDIGFGSLFKNDGVTRINEGDYITLAEGLAGLVFVPSLAITDGFFVQSAAADRATCIAGANALSQIVVSKAPLTATMPDQTMTYGSSPDLSVSYSGFVNGESENDLSATITVSTMVDNFTTAGSYPITVTGTTDSNYDITYIDGTITIQNALLSVTPNDKSITYGESIPTLDGTILGVVNGENINASYATAADGSSSGVFDITATLSDPDNKLGNYDTLVNAGTLTVNQATLIITANSKTINYGEAIPTLDGSILGITNNDAIEGSFNTSATANSDAGKYVITAGLIDPDNRQGNYQVTLQDDTLTILKADQIIAFELQDSVDLAEGNTLTLAGSVSSGLSLDYVLIGGDGSISGNTLTLNAVGTYRVAATQPGNQNFNSADTITLTFEVINSAKSNQEISFESPDDVRYGDLVTLAATVTSDLDITYELNEGVGSITDGVLTVQGIGNYTVIATQIGDDLFNPAVPVSQKFTVTKAPLTFTADDLIITEGEEIPTLTYEVTGFKLGESESVLDNPPTLITDANSESTIGTYPITWEEGVDDLYEYILIDGELTIETVLGIEESLTLVLFPNPANTFLTIHTPGGNGVIQVVDLQGKTLVEQSADKSNVIDVSGFSKGIYLVKYEDVKGIITRKLVIE